MTEAAAGQPGALWDAFLEAVRPTLSRHVLDAWLRPVHCVAVAGGTVTLAVRDQFFRDWLADHYLQFIRDGLAEQLGQPIKVAWAIDPGLGREAPAAPRATGAAAGARDGPAATPVAAAAMPLDAAARGADGAAIAVPAPADGDAPALVASVEEPAPPLAVATEAPQQAATVAAAGLGALGEDPDDDDDDDGATVAQSLDGALRRRKLNRRYTFDSFVGGPSNQFALAACKAVAEAPGRSYNPLFLFGGVGLGKTHLLSAIGHRILGETRDARVIYTSSEQFTNEVINAVLGSRLEEFRGKYRHTCDVILMDDIQLIAGKERTQHEFFHIFNTLYDSQRQIVVTSDKLPHEIPEIEERLRNRFQWGLIADIQPPEIETRIAILRKKAASEQLALSDEVAFFLAKHIRTNVRELEGALVRIMAHASLNGTQVTVDYARNLLSDILSNRGLQVSVEAVQKIVASFFQIRMADIRGSRRLRVLVRPRQIAMYLARKHTEASFPELGQRFGNKDHTTVLNACRRVEELVRKDPAIRGQVQDIERQLDVIIR